MLFSMPAKLRLSLFLSALPITTEVNAGLASHRQRRHGIDLCAVVYAAMILPPRALLGVADQIQTGNMVMMSDLRTPQTREEPFRTIGVDTALCAIKLLMIDPRHFVATMKIIPRRRFVRNQFSSRRNAISNKRDRRSFRPEDVNQGAPAPFAGGDDNLPFYDAFKALGKQPQLMLQTDDFTHALVQVDGQLYDYSGAVDYNPPVAPTTRASLMRAALKSGKSAYDVRGDAITAAEIIQTAQTWND